MRPPDLPRYALIVWPDAYDQTLPCCITFDGLPDAQKRGAVVIAREDDETCGRVPVVDRDLGDEDMPC